jgi:hypothetical protein
MLKILKSYLNILPVIEEKAIINLRKLCKKYIIKITK